jgi:hypothetical protein
LGIARTDPSAHGELQATPFVRHVRKQQVIQPRNRSRRLGREKPLKQPVCLQAPRRNASGLPLCATSAGAGTLRHARHSRSQDGAELASGAGRGRPVLAEQHGRGPRPAHSAWRTRGAAAHLAPGRAVQRLLQPLDEVRQLPLPVLVAVGLPPSKQLKTAQSTRHQNHRRARMRVQTHTNRQLGNAQSSGGS